MAKIRLGGLVGQISGSIASQTYSHNRYGQYVRNRSVPVKATSSYAMQAKAWLSQASQAWQNLTSDEQRAWFSWAETNPITDSFGEKRVLTGHAAYVKLNRRRLQDGAVLLSEPPVGEAPAPLSTLSFSADIGAGNFELTFTPSPLGAGLKLWLWAAVTDSAGIRYVKNRLRLVEITAANVASPYDPLAAIEARNGALVAGMRCTIEAQVYDVASGQLSGRLRVSEVVVST